MEKNKTGKYLKYAIGEIILVLIGILLALQINNYNEQRKERASWRTYTKSLIKDLEQDTTTLNMITEYIKNDSVSLEKITQRLSSKFTTNDTLIKIARYEINPNNKAYRPPNNKTFLAMQANGSIELFDDDIYAMLLELHTIQIIAESIIKENNSAYMSQISNYVSKYSFNDFSSIKGPLSDSAWQNINVDDLYRRVDGLLSVKKIMNRYTYKRYMEVLLATEKTLSQLKKVHNGQYKK